MRKRRNVCVKVQSGHTFWMDFINLYHSLTYCKNWDADSDSNNVCPHRLIYLNTCSLDGGTV